MAVTFTVPVYGLTGNNKKIFIGNTYKTINNAQKLGGKIFYIDSTASGATYTFYDSEGEVITDVRVGDEPYAYSVTGTPIKDKFYCFNSNAVTSKTWTYQSEGSWVYESLGTTDTIGSGKTNTATVMTASGGAYADYNVAGSASIWNAIKNLNASVDKGCSDWYVGSVAELETLRLATDRDGNALTTLFENTVIWSSVENSSQDAMYWNYESGSQHGWGHWHNKNANNSLVPTRSF